MLAYDYPILGFFWSTLILFLWIAWFVLLFRVLADIFRSHDLGGFAKTLWILFVIFLPFLGVFVYIIAHGDQMTEHAIEDHQRQQEAFNGMVRSAVPSTSVADEISKLAELKARAPSPTRSSRRRRRSCCRADHGRHGPQSRRVSRRRCVTGPGVCGRRADLVDGCVGQALELATTPGGRRGPTARSGSGQRARLEGAGMPGRARRRPVVQDGGHGAPRSAASAAPAPRAAPAGRSLRTGDAAHGPGPRCSGGTGPTGPHRGGGTCGTRLRSRS